MLITLTTDFGYRDAFVGIMKGVIATINPQVRVIDVTHGIPPQDVMAAALTLRHAVKYFPLGTIHVVVVDPGVGGTRRPLLIESAGNYFIGPDNGVLSLAVAGNPQRVVQLANPQYQLKPTGTTFHGRDIFAPAAAHLALGAPIANFGERLSSIIALKVPQAARAQNRLDGEIVYIDGYGNLFTNITEHDLTGLPSDRLSIAIGSTTVLGLVPSYDTVKAQDLAALVNSWGMLEVAAYKANAQQKCNAKIGDKIILTWTV
jgi:S-adenosyl-L-methionine hydrolase (adenosine-forming)